MEDLAANHKAYYERFIAKSFGQESSCGNVKIIAYSCPFGCDSDFLKTSILGAREIVNISSNFELLALFVPDRPSDSV